MFGLMMVTSMALTAVLAFLLRGACLIKQVRKQRRLGDLSITPWFSQLACCLVWLKYGLLIGNAITILMSFFGTLCAIYYLMACRPYYIEELDHFKLQAVGAFVPIFAILIGGRFVGLYTPTLLYIQFFVGATTLFFVGAPLLRIRTVFSRRSAAALDFRQCSLGLVCSVWCTIYGFLAYEEFLTHVGIPSTFIATLEILLFTLYPSSRDAPAVKTQNIV